MERTSLDRLISSVTMTSGLQVLQPSNIEKKKNRVLEVVGNTANIHVCGTLLKSVPQFLRDYGISATGYVDIADAVHQAVDNPAVQQIKLKIDSPGGCVDGVEIAADAIYAARNVKSVVAECGGCCASAAYWLASQAENITAPQTALVGSIGVYSVVADYSEMYKMNGILTHVFRSGNLKGAGLPGDQLTEEQSAVEQELVDSMAALFQKYVSRGRKKNAEMIKEWMTGRVWTAPAALDLGLIDQIESNLTESNSTETRTASMKNAIKAEVVEEEDVVLDEKAKAEDEEVIEDVVDEEEVTDEEVVDEEVVDEEVVDEEVVVEDDEKTTEEVDVEDPVDEENPEQIEDEEATKQAASVHQLEAEFSDNPKFVIESLKNNWSLLEAKAAYSDVLREKMKKNAKGASPLAFSTSEKKPVDFWSLVNEKTSNGKTKIQAMAEVHRENPGISVPMKNK